jgi:hypothetical protein
MRKAIGFIIFSLCSLAVADDLPSRKSYLQLSGGAGDYKYRYGGITAAWGIDPVWLTSLSYSQATDESDSKSTEVRLRGDAALDDDWGIRFSLLQKTEPADIRGTGASLGGEKAFDSLLGEDLYTSFFLDLEYTRYIQTSTRFLRIREGEDLRQRVVSVGASQDILVNLNATLLFSSSSYDGKDPDAWATQVAEKRAPEAGSLGYVKGFTKSRSSLQIAWQPLTWLSTDITASTSKSTTDVETKSLGLGFGFILDQHWSLDATLNGSRTDGERDGATGGLSARYTF